MPTLSSPLYLGGEWRQASDHRHTLDILNPYDGSAVGTVAMASSAETGMAVETARRGFERVRLLQSFERYEILSSIAAQLKTRKEEIAALITAEVGKPRTAARVEVDRSILTFQYAAEEARRFGGDVVPLDLTRAGENKFGIVRRFPLGVVLAITPFNFPLNLVAHKVAPALASGNAVIVKPSPQGALTSLKLAEIIDNSGLPKEAFSVLPCRNEEAETLVTSPGIAMMSFTGSPAVGWALKAKAGRKKVVLELGGNAGVIVDRSANVEQAVAKNLAGSFAYAGQVCIKVQRIYVQKDFFEDYCRQFVMGAAALVQGDPQREDVFLGPVISSGARERILSWIDEARAQGATVLCGGGARGNIVEPTVLANVPPNTKIFCSEVFGPVVTIHPFGSIEEAVSGVNNSEFGLQAGIFSNDYSNILYAYRNLEVGAVVVNDNPTFRVDNMPYGGIKSSGFGREGVRYAMEEMTEPKMLALGG